MRAVCAWCGKDLQIKPPTDLPGTTHGICEECLLGLRVTETLKRLRGGAGPYPLFLPPNREDLVLRIWREAPPGCSFIVYADRRQGERRGRRVPVPTDRRTGRDRRCGNLSLLSLRLLEARNPSNPRPARPAASGDGSAPPPCRRP